MIHTFSKYLWAAACGILIFCGKPLPASPPITQSVMVVYTADGNSVLTNCGCSTENLGGIERRARLFQQIRDAGQPAVFVDSGDFLSMASIWERDSLVVDILERLAYDAITLGDQDFLNGPDFFKSILPPDRLPLVATNVTIQQVAPLAASRIVQTGELSIGIVSAVNARSFFFVEEIIERYWSLEDHIAAVTREIDNLQDEVDLIICLSHLGMQKDRELADACPDLDIILGAHSKDFTTEPIVVGNTYIVQPGAYGEYVGTLQVSVDDQGRITDALNTLMPLNESVEAEPVTMAMIQQFQEDQQNGNGAVDVYVAPIPPQYLVAPAAQCQPCHAEEATHWQTTKHSHAIDALTQDIDRRNPECLSCHTSGFGRSDGYTREFAETALAMVSCVDCHFTPTEHLLNPAGVNVAEISSYTCTRCHNEMNSPDFEYLTYRLQIDH